MALASVSQDRFLYDKNSLNGEWLHWWGCGLRLKHMDLLVNYSQTSDDLQIRSLDRERHTIFTASRMTLPYLTPFKIHFLS